MIKISEKAAFVAVATDQREKGDQIKSTKDLARDGNTALLMGLT